jgi:short-subunit dehydrogenase
MRMLMDAWRRRWWRPDAAALAVYAGLRPMVVVTGGSDGIGYALARRFAASGSDVMLVARRPEPLERAAAALRAELKVDAVAVPADVTAPGAIARIDQALAAHGAYADVLVNSAGIGLAGPFHVEAPEDLMRLVDLNVRALTALTRHYLPGMRARGRGGILNIASLGGYTPGPYQAAYYASKAYVISLTEAVAAETSGEGVRVCVLAPGPVKTAWHDRAGAGAAFYRYLLPKSAASVARTGHLGYTLGLRVVVPGLLSPILAVTLRIMPHAITVPIVRWLLKPR